MIRRLAHLPIVDTIRARVREAEQVRRFERVVAQARCPAPEPQSFPLGLELLGGARKPLSKRPRVLAVGHDAWERYGLWPAFEQVADFELYVIPMEQTWTPSRRAGLAAAVMSRVEGGLRRGAEPEVVYFYCDSYFLEPELLRMLSRRGIWTVLMGLDDQHRMQVRRENGIQVGQALLVPFADVYWTTWRLGAAVAASLGGRPYYAAEGADPAIHAPIALERDLEIVFIGAKYGARKALVEALGRAGLNVATFGKGWGSGFVDFKKSLELYSRARVVLGIGNVGEMRGVHCLKGRDFEVPMSGAVYVTSYNPDLADWFDIGREVLCYSSAAQCIEVLRGALSDEVRLQRIRSAARARSVRDHTWESRLSRLFEHMRNAVQDRKEARTLERPRSSGREAR